MAVIYWSLNLNVPLSDTSYLHSLAGHVIFLLKKSLPKCFYYWLPLTYRIKYKHFDFIYKEKEILPNITPLTL